jgi:predicted nucleotidyltransferase
MEKKNKPFPTPYPELNRVLRDFVESVQVALSTNFVGAYLQGSFAVGDFDLHSDVDFIVVTEEELLPSEVHDLQEVHERIYGLDIPWAQHLEGSYFPKEVLRDHGRQGERLWYLDHGSRSLLQSTHCNTVLVRWVVREQGVTLAGPAPALLVDPIPVEALREHIRATILDWGQEILSHPDPYKNRFYQGFIVLNYCRMLHDLHRGVPGSKLAGAQWAKANLDPGWQGLIDRAWNGRPDPAVSSREPADPHDFKTTLEFIHYCRNKANT